MEVNLVRLGFIDINLWLLPGACEEYTSCLDHNQKNHRSSTVREDTGTELFECSHIDCASVLYHKRRG